MSKGSHVKITMAGLGKNDTQVFVDGVEVARVLNVEFQHFHDSFPSVLITFWPESVEIEGDAIMEQVE